MPLDFKNMFKSKQQLEIEARMEYNRNKRAFAKYYTQLDGVIKQFSKMAVDAQRSGNRQNALACAAFIGKLRRAQTKVQSLMQRFEMMNAMSQMSGVMTNFMQACAKMGVKMDKEMDLNKMMRSQAEMEVAMSKLDAMSDAMDQAFDSIDSGMGFADGNMDEAELGLEAENILNGLMGIENVNQTAAAMPTYAAPMAAAPMPTMPVMPGFEKAAPQAAAPADDTDARLAKLLDELK